MVIGVTINGVIRDFIGKFEMVYKKYQDTDPIKPIDSFNLLEHFPFSGGTTELNTFMYKDSSLELFGHANELHFNVVNCLNQLQDYTSTKDDVELVLISRENLNSKPSTLFFLSKTSCKIDNIKFVREYEDKWDYVDVLVTANPICLNNKPEDKISVKVNTEYNLNIKSDFEIDNLKDLLDDKTMLEKIINK